MCRSRFVYLAKPDCRTPTGCSRSRCAAALWLSGAREPSRAASVMTEERIGPIGPAAAAAVFRELERRPLDLPRVDLDGRSIREYGVAGRCVEGRGTEVNAPVLRAVVPTVAALGPWPLGPSHHRGPVYAALPEGAPRIVFLSVLPPIRDSRSCLVRTLWISRPSYDGPVLVRGGRLDRPGALGFGEGDPPRESLRLPA